MKYVDAVFIAILVAVGAACVVGVHRLIGRLPYQKRRLAPFLFLFPIFCLALVFRGYLSLKSVAYPVDGIWTIQSPAPGFLFKSARQAGSRRVSVVVPEYIAVSRTGEILERNETEAEPALLKRLSAASIEEGADRCHERAAALAQPEVTGLGEVRSMRAACKEDTMVLVATGVRRNASLLDRILQRTYLRLVFIEKGSVKWSMELHVPAG